MLVKYGQSSTESGLLLSVKEKIARKEEEQKVHCQCFHPFSTSEGPQELTALLVQRELYDVERLSTPPMAKETQTLAPLQQVRTSPRNRALTVCLVLEGVTLACKVGIV